MLSDNTIKPLVLEAQCCTPNLSRVSALLSLEKGCSSNKGKVNRVRREMVLGVLIPNLSTRIPETRKHWAVCTHHGREEEDEEFLPHAQVWDASTIQEQIKEHLLYFNKTKHGGSCN